MQKNLKIKALLVVIVAALAIWKLYPPFDIRDKEGNIIDKGRINLGLDLRGGMQLILEVDTSKLTPEEAKDAPDRALEVIRNRIDQFGVLEPSIQRRGKNRIIVQLPGVTDRSRAIEIVGKTAHLEFRLVSDDPELLKKAFAGETVEGYELMRHQTREGGLEELLVEIKAALTGDMLINARKDFSSQTFNQPYVSLTLNSKGAAIFSAVTERNVGKRLAIVLDGVVQTAPVIRERIPSGQAQISGTFSNEEADDLAIVLRAGALPAPVKIMEEITVGPALGKDSIDKGVKATIVGAVLVVGLIAGYYLVPGLVANLALFLNLILILGAMAYFHATLTLPGIAGLVLTIGMAVDANVLIFERIREETALGKSIRAAIQAGFSKAFLTIFDSNITTLFSGLILFQFGTGPVRGFATTLCIGIAASLFTSIIVTRLVLDFMTLGETGVRKLPMLQFFKKTNIDFIKFRKLAYIFSIAAIAFGMFVFFQRGERNFGVDFTGGTYLNVRFEKEIKVDDVRQALGTLGLADSTIQGSSDLKEILIRAPGDPSTQILEGFRQKFADNKFEIIEVESVGPAVSRDLAKRAVQATILAMLGILIYVAFRFEFKFAVCAVIALFHDVFISVGFMALTGREISLPVIAAILTIIGYSINDTIVIFDRIREDRRLMAKATFREIVNTSINQTLSRTFLTSFTTLLVVLSLYFLGGEKINDFAFCMMCGVIFGSYSTVFVASPLLYDWAGTRHRKKG